MRDKTNHWVTHERFNSKSKPVKANTVEGEKKIHHLKHTYPIVSTHWVESIGTTDKNHLIVSWNKDFDKVVALILREE